MRRAEWVAYFQGAVILMLAVGGVVVGSDWRYPLLFAGIALLLGALGYLVGRRHSAAAALVLLVLGVTVAQLIGGSGRRPALVFVAIFAWTYGKAFSAAREYADLHSILLDANVGAG
jgi:hypothetical protein